MTLDQAAAYRHGPIIAGELQYHPPLRTPGQVLLQRRMAQLELAEAIVRRTSKGGAVELEPGPQEAR